MPAVGGVGARTGAGQRQSPPARDHPVSRAAPAAASLLGLQRGAGNRAVADLVGRRGGARLTVQRAFGFEMQTGNEFVKSCVPERQVAFSDGKGLTVEADEGGDKDTVLEFVTKASTGTKESLQVVDRAADLAAMLADRSGSENPFVVHKGQGMAGGTWERDCTIKVVDPAFTAAMQGTLGVPLAMLPKLVATVYGRLERAGLKKIEEGVASGDRSAMTPELAGFLTALHMFVTEAVDLDPPVYPPYWDKRYNPVFDFTDIPYITEMDYFEIGSSGRHFVLISPDGPKTVFPLLARSDFHAMYRSLPTTDREAFDKRVETGALWKEIGVSDETTAKKTWTFPYPYRADEAAGDVLRRVPQEWVLTRKPYAGVDTETAWKIVVHGPSVFDWVTSIRAGDPKRGTETAYPKDVASPPPGYGSRSAQNATKFPQPGEDKSTYYGMGAFPMDAHSKDGPTPTPLAVFEHRKLSYDPGFSKFGGDVPAAKWHGAAEVFIETFVRGHGPLED